MAKTIDEKVVSMKFDNKNFEKNVSSTMSALDKLKNSLKFTGASKGFEQVSDAARTNFGKTEIFATQAGFHIQDVFEKVTRYLEYNIASRIVQVGTNIAKALTIDPLKMGFNEYELKMGSIQTIMAGTGESLQTVSAYLNELNEYSDRTIYSFQDMTSNIGKFTNAGVKLDKAVLAIKGVSNEAAISGANAQEAARAMYNFSQALSSGYVKLIDWKSIENANMATVEFKNQLLETGVALGTLTKKGDMYVTTSGKELNATHNFNDCLQEQWMTSEVLIETLGKYADETTDIGKKAFAAAQDVKTFSMFMDTLKESVQSGWAQSFEIIIGDFNQAKRLFTEMSNAAGKVVDVISGTRNAFLKEVFGSTKLTELTQQLKKAGIEVDSFKNKIREVANAHGMSIDEMIEQEGSLEAVIEKNGLATDIFKEAIKDLATEGNNTSQVTENMVKRLSDFQEVVKKANKEAKSQAEFSDILAENGYNYAQAQELVNEVLEDGTLKLEDLTGAQLKAIGYTDEEIIKIKGLAKAAEEAGTPLNKLIESLSKPTGRELLIDSFRNIGKAIVQIVETVRKAWQDIFPSDLEGKANVIYKIIETFNKLTKSLILSENTSNKLRRTLAGLFSIFGLLWDIVSKVAGTIINAFTNISFAAGDATGGVLDGILSITAVIGDALKAFNQWIQHSFILQGALNLLSWVLNGITSFIGKVVHAIREFVFESEILDTIITEIHKALKPVKDTIKDFGNNIKSSALNMVEFIKNSEFVQNILEKIRYALANSKEVVQGWVDAFKNFDLGNAIQNLPQGFSDFANRIQEFFGSLQLNFKNIGNFIITGFLVGISSSFGTIIKYMGFFGKNIIDTVCAILGIHSPSTEFEEIGENTGLGFLKGFEKTAKKILDTINRFFNNILDDIQNLNLGKIFSAAITVGFLYTMNTLFKSLYNLSKPIASVSKVISSIGDSITRLGKALALNLKAQAVKNFAISIGILAASLFVLSQIDPIQLLKAVIAIGLLAGILVGLTFAASKLSAASIELTKAGASIRKTGGILVALTASILLLSIAMKIVGTLNIDQAIQGFSSLAVLFVIIGGALFAFGALAQKTRIDGTSINSFGVTLLKISASLILMSLVIKLLGGMDERALSQGIDAIAHFTLLIIGLMAATKLISGSSNIGSMGKSLLQIAAAITLMGITAKLLGNMDTGSLIKGTIFIAAFSGIIVGLMAATKLINGSRNVSSIGKAILGIAGAITLMGLTVKILGNMNLGSLIKGTVIIGAFSGIIVGLMYAVKKIGGRKGSLGIAATMVGLGMALTAMSAALLLLSFIELPALIKGVAAMGFLALFVKMMVKATKGAKDCKGSMIGLAVVIGILAGSVALLSFIDWTRLLPATIALSMLMSMFALMEKMAKNTKKALPGIIVMTVVVAALATMIWLLSDINAEGALAASASISAVLLAISFSLEITKGMSRKAMTTLKLMGPMLLIVAGLAAIISIFSAINPEGAIPAAASLSVLLLAMTGALGILQLIGTKANKGLVALALLELLSLGLVEILKTMTDMNPEQAIGTAIALTTFLLGMSAVCGMLTLVGLGRTAVFYGLAALGILIVGLFAILEGLAALNELTEGGAERFLNEGIPLLEKIGFALGSFFGNIAKGFAEAAMSSLPSIGTSLSQFMINLTPFLIGLKLLDESSINAAQALGNMVLAIAGAEILNSVSKFLGSGDILTSFARQLIPFGASMVAFSTMVSGKIDEKAITSAANCGKMLAELAQNLPNQEGVVQFWAGKQDLSTFATQLEPLGQALSAFSKSVSGDNAVSPEAVQAAANAGKLLAELANNLPNSEGALQFWAGKQDLSTFATQLSPLGEALAAFSRSVSGDNEVDPASVESATNAAKLLAALAKELPNEEGALQWWAGKQDLENFGAQIASFGGKLGDFQENLRGFSPESLTSIIGPISQMLEFMKGLEGFKGEGVNQFFDALSRMIDFNGVEAGFQAEGRALASNLAVGIQTNAYEISDALNNALNVQSIDGMLETLQAQGRAMSSNIAAGIWNNSGEVDDGINNIMSNSISIIDGWLPVFQAQGRAIDSNVAAGIWTNIPDITNAVNGMVSSISNSISSLYDTFRNLGHSVPEGFAQGVWDEVHKADQAVRDMSQSAVDALKEKLGINSPSKVFNFLGQGIPEGMVLGIKALTPAVIKATQDLASQTANQAESALSGINQNGVLQPKISPIFDMNSIRTSKLNITGNLDTMLVKPVDSLSTMISDAQRNVTDSNNKVIEAIDGFREDFGEFLNKPTEEIAMYVNGKKLASTIAKPMNKELGKLSKWGV